MSGLLGVCPSITIVSNVSVMVYITTICRSTVTCPNCAEVVHDGKLCENSECTPIVRIIMQHTPVFLSIYVEKIIDIKIL